MCIHESIYVWVVGVRAFESQTEQKREKAKENEMNPRTNDTHTQTHTNTHSYVCVYVYMNRTCGGKATNWTRVCIKNLGIV